MTACPRPCLWPHCRPCPYPAIAGVRNPYQVISGTWLVLSFRRYACILVVWYPRTSKDIVVSAAAMSSLLIQQCIRITISKVSSGIYTLEEIACTTTLLSGLLLLVIWVIRLGWPAKQVPNVAVIAFAAAFSLKITTSPLSTMLGISNVSGPSHIALIEIIRNIHHMKIDAVFGISTIVLLVILGRLCTMVRR